MQGMRRIVEDGSRKMMPISFQHRMHDASRVLNSDAGEARHGDLSYARVSGERITTIVSAMKVGTPLARGSLSCGKARPGLVGVHRLCRSNAAPPASIARRGRRSSRSSDAEHYNYFRDYDPGIGRYIEADPIGLQGGINSYGYVSARPTRSKDPYGLKECEKCRCEGGTWDQEAGDFGISLAGGMYGGGANQNVICRSNNKIRCRTTQFCVGGGAIIGAGIGWSTIGTITGVESCSGLGGAWSQTQVTAGAGPLSGQGGFNTGSGSLSLGPSYGGGVALITCYTIFWGCTGQ
jgi:RHS repeat-associated protein